jgi:hypothetical protein
MIPMCLFIVKEYYSHNSHIKSSLPLNNNNFTSQHYSTFTTFRYNAQIGSSGFSQHQLLLLQKFSFSMRTPVSVAWSSSHLSSFHIRTSFSNISLLCYSLNHSTNEHMTQLPLPLHYHLLSPHAHNINFLVSIIWVSQMFWNKQNFCFCVLCWELIIVFCTKYHWTNKFK